MGEDYRSTAMHNLLDSLSGYGETMLRGIATQWEVPAGEVESLPGRLAEAMLEPARLRGFVAGLDDDTRAALAEVAAAGGAMRGYLLARRYGEIRRLGPRAVEREEPWRHPAGASERLYYAGLIYRRYARLGAYHGEVLYIPPDLLAALPPQEPAQAVFTLEPAPPPEQAWEHAGTLALDLETLLARLRIEPVPTGRGAGLPQSFVSRLQARWRGGADPERLALLERLAFRLRLVGKRRDHWQVSGRARTWLSLAPYRRQKALFDAWQGDAHWNELWRIPSLRCEDTGWRNDPLAARNAILAALRRCPEGWLPLSGLTAAIKATQPDFARPDGDYDSWYIRDAQTGQYLQGFARWDDVEGTLIAHLVARPLFWLGAVELGAPAGASAAAVFRLTAHGRAFLRLAAPPPAAHPAPLQVRDDLRILAPPEASALDRARLERLARWEGREGTADLYRLDPEVAWQAFNSGINARQIAAFLQRAGGRPLPAPLTQALHNWSAGFGRVTLRRAILLQTVNAETLRLLRNDPELGQRFGATVSDRAVLIPEDELDHVLARLKALRLWPRLVELG